MQVLLAVGAMVVFVVVLFTELAIRSGGAQGVLQVFLVLGPFALSGLGIIVAICGRR
jgi:hypothetical protein